MTDLWALHVAGPDDVVPMPDRATAQARADEVNAIAAAYRARPDASPDDPPVSASVVPWDGTPEDHAESVAEHGGQYEM